MTKYSYQRCSTRKELQSLLRQEKFARDNGVPKENWYQEYASGAKDDRVELQKLLSVLKENDELYIIDASRLTRGMSFLLKMLALFRDKKIKLVMGDFILDCTGSLSVLTQGQIMMLGLLNEMNRLMIVESVKEGLAAAREEGRVGGQPRLTKERLYAKNPDFPRFYLEYRNKNITFTQLCRVCGISRNTGYSYIKLIES